MCTDPRECVCALWLCLMITMWGIIANTCEPFPFAAMKSLHEKRARADSSPQHSFVPSPQHLEGSEVSARRSMRSDTGVLFQKAGDMRGCLQQGSFRIKRPARKLTEFLGSTILTSKAIRHFTGTIWLWSICWPAVASHPPFETGLNALNRAPLLKSRTSGKVLLILWNSIRSIWGKSADRRG